MAKKAKVGKDRAALLAAMRSEQRRADRRRMSLYAAGAGALVLVLTGAVVWAVLGAQKAQSLAGVVSYSNLSRNHIQGTLTYPQTPPVGGNHNPVWLNCGIYTSPVRNENAVHSLEHGAVWVTYRPDLAGSQVKTLQTDLFGLKYGLLSPYPGLPSPVVATVWGKQLKLPSADDPRLKVFIAKYADGTQAPEAGGYCTGGTGTPNL